MKSSTILLICSLFISTLSVAQTSVEQFETESTGSSSFTDNGVIFNILSHQGTFDIHTFPNAGWTGTARDQKFIDNSGSIGSNRSFSIKTTSNLFKVNRFWIFCGDLNTNPNVAGTLTITGKLSGVTKFSQTKTDGFTMNTNITNNGTNGYTLIDLTNLNGQNYSNIIIDQIQITGAGGFQYLALDTFTWVKDSGIVLSANEIAKSKNNLSISPNPTTGQFSVEISENSKAQLYDQSGKAIKEFELKKGNNEENISELPSGTYLLKTSSQTKKIIKR